MKEINVMGLKVHNVSMHQALEAMDELVKDKKAHLVVTLGVEMVMKAEKDREFFEIINQASLVVPDSVGILWAAKKMGSPLKQRVPGIDLIHSAARENQKYPWKIFFLGAAPGVAEKAARKLEELYPGFSVAGVHHGYFEDDGEVIDKINKCNPDVLFIAMGSPTQEKWFVRNRDKLKEVVAIGVGGSFDVISGRLKRAPPIFRKLGLEWFYRLITQPSRIKRMLALPAFAIKILTRRV